VRASNGAHTVGCRLIIKKDAAAPIGLQINEAGGEEATGREPRLRPIRGNIAPGPKPNNATAPNQHRGSNMPGVTVKNTVGEERIPVGD
jgi:hypothetical protein